MSKSSAFIWLIPGFVVSVFDALLSMQSLIGMMNPPDPIWQVAVVGLGGLLTASAIGLPVHLRKNRDSRGLRVVWLALATFDVATSICGAIWYAQLKHPYEEPVDFSKLTFKFGNVLTTSLYVFVVALVMWICYMFGKAIDTLRA